MVSGRKPGYKHSAETIEKIRQSRLGNKQSAAARTKISNSMSGKTKSAAHKKGISDSLHDLEGKCAKRLNALKEEYPGQEPFFERNKEDLLFAMQDVKSEQELRDIMRYIEVGPLYSSIPYQYSSSSYFAAEDVMIALIDTAAFIRKFR